MAQSKVEEKEDILFKNKTRTPKPLNKTNVPAKSEPSKPRRKRKKKVYWTQGDEHAASMAKAVERRRKHLLAKNKKNKNKKQNPFSRKQK